MFIGWNGHNALNIRFIRFSLYKSKKKNADHHHKKKGITREKYAFFTCTKQNQPTTT